MTKMLVAGNGRIKVYDLLSSLQMCLQTSLAGDDVVPAITVQWPLYYVERFGSGYTTLFVAC